MISPMTSATFSPEDAQDHLAQLNYQAYLAQQQQQQQQQQPSHGDQAEGGQESNVHSDRLSCDQCIFTTASAEEFQDHLSVSRLGCGFVVHVYKLRYHREFP